MSLANLSPGWIIGSGWPASSLPDLPDSWWDNLMQAVGIGSASLPSGEQRVWETEIPAESLWSRGLFCGYTTMCLSEGQSIMSASLSCPLSSTMTTEHREPRGPAASIDSTSTSVHAAGGDGALLGKQMKWGKDKVLDDEGGNSC